MIWSDETKVNRFGSDGKVYASKQPNEKLKRRHVKQTVKHGGGSLMVWSCISWYGVGYIVDVGKNMDKSVYLSVLQDDLVKSMTGYCEENDLIMADFEFMQDNDPKHKSKIVSEWLSKQDFTAMECPPQSPDLNPIENMWNTLKNACLNSMIVLLPLWMNYGLVRSRLGTKLPKKNVKIILKLCLNDVLTL